MITYKSGDLWKVVVLVILIAATFFVSFHFVLASGLGPATAGRSGQKVAQGAATPAAPKREIFAPRAHPTSELLMRARASADPFKPYVTAASAAPSQPNTASSAPRTAGALPPPLAPGQPRFRLIGLITGTYPLAVIAGEDTRYFVRVGDSLPSGWRVAKLERNAVVLAKGADRITLAMPSGTRVS